MLQPDAMLQAALLVMLHTAPEAAPAPPADPTPTAGELPAPGEPAAPGAVPAAPPAPPAPDASSVPAEPAPPVPEGPAPAPEKPAHERPPAIARTDTTVLNASTDNESPVAKAGHKFGKGLTVATKDGRFSLQVRGRIQVRYDLEHPNQDGKAIQQAIQIRRMRLQLQGNVFSPFVRYYFQFGFSPRDMSNDLPSEPSIRRNPVRDARIEIDRLRDFNVWIGQFKVPFSRQRRVSSSALNMVDRSLVNAEFNVDRDVGIQVMSKDLGGLGGRLAYYAGVFMGSGRNAFELAEPHMLAVGRFEVLPFGKFDDYSEGDLARSRTPGLSIAGAYAFQDRGPGVRGNVGEYPADRGTTNFHHVTADLMFKWRGVSLNTAFHLRKGYNRKGGGALDDNGVEIPTVAARQGLGWFGQLGYVVPKIPLEVVGRYALVRNNYGKTLSSLPDADEAGGGLNYYFINHDLKVQLDYFRVWDESMGMTPGERARNGTDRLRLHVQVYF